MDAPSSKAPQGEDRAMSGHRITYYRCGQHIETPCRCPGPHIATIGMTTCPVCSAKPPQAKQEFDIASGYHARWMEAEAEAETLRRENAKLREALVEIRDGGSIVHGNGTAEEVARAALDPSTTGTK